MSFSVGGELFMDFSVGGELFMDDMIIETRFSKITNRKKLRLVILESTRRRW